MLCEAVENKTVSQVSLKSKFVLPRVSWTYFSLHLFYLFNHNKPLPRGLLFLEGENGTAEGWMTTVTVLIKHDPPSWMRGLALTGTSVMRGCQPLKQE